MQQINAIDYGLNEANTGFDNVTSLRAALAASIQLSVPTVYVPDGTYTVETDIFHGRTIDIFDNQAVRLAYGAELRAVLPSNSTPHSHPVFFMRGHNSSIGGGKIVGTMTSNHYGIIVNEGTYGNLVEGVTVENFGGDAVVSYGSGVAIRNIRAKNIGRNGISIGGGSNIKINDCILWGIGSVGEPGAGITCEPGPDHAVDNVRISQNCIIDAVIGIYVQSGQSTTSSAKVTKNKIFNAGIWAINIHRVCGGEARKNLLVGENKRVSVTESDFSLQQNWEDFHA